MISKTYFALFLCLASLAGVVQTDSYEINLYKYLMDADRYEAAVRPTPHHRLATNVTFGFLLHQVINVDEKNQQLTTSSWMNVNWMDQRLVWNHSEWGGVKLLHIPNQKVWKPDLILTNNADHEYKESIVSTDVFVTPEGNVTWLYFAIYQSACHIRVRFYPFDDQECGLTFASWSYDGNNIDLRLLTEEGDLSNYVNSSEWALLSMIAKRRVLRFSVGHTPWPVVTITVQLGRRPLFYVFNHIIPCVLISIMSMLGFYIPAETGEKVTMCITTLLSMGVFLKTITESMPPSSEAIPLIGMYYVVSLFLVCAATVVNVITLNVHNRGSKNTPSPIPRWARKYILGYMANWVCISVYPCDAHMLHLAEVRLQFFQRRRQLGNDEELINEITVSNNCAQTFHNPVIITSDADEETSNGLPEDERPARNALDPTRRSSESINECLNVREKRSSSNLLVSDVANEVKRQRRARVASQVFFEHHFRQVHPATASRQPESKSDRLRSQKFRNRTIYDCDYELKSLRKLNSQARLISGALTLMQAPLECPGSNDLLDQSLHEPKYDNLARFDTLIGTNRLSTLRGARHKGRLHPGNHHGVTMGNTRQQQSSPAAYLQRPKQAPAGEDQFVVLKRDMEQHFCRLLKKVYHTLEQNELRTALHEERTQIMWEWKQLAIVVDRLFLLLFVLATALTTFLILFERVIFEDNMLPREDNAPSVI